MLSASHTKVSGTIRCLPYLVLKRKVLAARRPPGVERTDIASKSWRDGGATQD